MRNLFNLDTERWDAGNKRLNEKIYAIEQEISDLRDREMALRMEAFSRLPMVHVEHRGGGRGFDKPRRLVRFNEGYLWLAEGCSPMQIQDAWKFSRSTGIHIPFAGPQWVSSIFIADLDALERAIAGGEE